MKKRTCYVELGEEFIRPNGSAIYVGRGLFEIHDVIGEGLTDEDERIFLQELTDSDVIAMVYDTHGADKRYAKVEYLDD